MNDTSINYTVVAAATDYNHHQHTQEIWCHCFVTNIKIPTTKERNKEGNMSDYENLLSKIFNNKTFKMFSLRMEEIRRNPLQGSVPIYAVKCW